MVHFLKRIFGKADPTDFRALIRNGARIIDVRTPQEFRLGHIEEARNIPLQLLQARIDELDPSDTLILCCASGSRSGTAKRILKSYGFNEVYNGGGWKQLQSRIS